METHFSPKDVAAILELQESRVRYWAQTGVVGPSVRRGGRFFYTFQDLIGVKVAKELLASGITLQRVRKNLEALRTTLPQVDRPLARLRIASDGDRVVVLEGDRAFEPESGQVVMDFAVAQLSRHAAEVLDLPGQRDAAQASAAPPPDAQERRSAYEWFLEGCALDEQQGRDGEAEGAYLHALELDPGLAAAHTNLGNLYFRRAERPDARARYEQALAIDPDQPEARYNLANVLDELGEVELAVGEYRRALTACPDFADAHYNLALALLRLGGRAQARQHLQRYLELVGPIDPEGADAARQHLERLS